MPALLLAWLATACTPQDESNCVNEFYADVDGDGHGVPEASVTGCTAPTGYETTHDDCDDGNSAVHPDAKELCNGIDDDCDGKVDPFPPWYVDSDRDGYGNDSTRSCDTRISPSADVGGDCNEADSTVHPEADEICNGVDDNCDDIVDTDAIDRSTSYTDADGDGYGDDATAYTSCDVPTATVLIGGDCDDTDAGIGAPTTQYADEDEDGFGDPTTATDACPIPGWVHDATDCNDTSAAANPDGDEICNGIDDDCDGFTDDADPSVTGRTVFYVDGDLDGFGTLPDVILCVAPTEFYATTYGDCDDSRSTVGGPTTMYRDQDGDGYGSAPSDRCGAPTGEWILTDEDCDDSESAVFPGAAEICNGVDDNCDALVDDADPLVEWPTSYADADGDGYGDADTTTVAKSCVLPSGYVADDRDCDDDDDTIHPAATEACDDGVDNNCNGVVDDDAAYTRWYTDADADGYGDDSDSVYTCDGEVPEDHVLLAGDCDDTEGAIHPGADEICLNDEDDNCDGVADVCRLGVEDMGFSLVGPTASGDVSTLGYQVLATDLNADGVSDLVATGPDIDPPVYVLFGPQSGESTLGDADLTFTSGAGSELGDAIGSADADLDGDADLLLGAPGDHTAYLFLGPVTASADVSAADASFTAAAHGASATAVTIVPDHDGDGMPDVAVNAADHTPGGREGEVYLAPATTTGSIDLRTDATYIYDGAADYELGSSIVAIGDTTGDGIEELALGASGPRASEVFVIAGGGAAGSYAVTDAAIATLSSSLGGDRFGASIDAADSDLDGYADLFVGAPINTSSVYAFRGPFDGARGADDADARWEGEPAMGFSVAAGGDVDADGNPDVLIGACIPASASGIAFLSFGPTEGVVEAADLTSFKTGRDGVTGYSVDFVPDWTGDGGSEIALGAPFVPSPSTGSGESHVYVVFSDAD